MGEIPIQFTELFQIAQLGVSPSAITFSTVTMESDKFICIRDVQQKSIIIIDVANRSLTTNKVNAESAIMNPISKVLALRAGTTLQIFNLEMRAKMKEVDMGEAVLFWKWISASSLAIVTATAVYHWSMEGAATPKKMFDRLDKLEGATIINYRVNTSQQWLTLIGLTRDEQNATRGIIQLYSVEKEVTQAIEGHAAAFCDFKLSHSYTATVICIASNSAREGGKLFIMEVPSGNKKPGDPAFVKRMVPIKFPAPGDFPVAMQVSDKHGVIYMITKTGFLYLFDVETAALIYQNRISAETIFITATHEASNGVIGINKTGQVLNIAVDESTIVGFIRDHMNDTELAIKIAARANLSGADELYVQQFNTFLQQGNIEGAIKLAAESPNGVLRTQQTIQRLQRAPAQPNQKPPMSLYFQYIIDKGTLNQYESIELCRIVLQKPQGGADYIKKLISENKMEASESLGDLIAQSGQSNELAMTIYLKSKSHQKIVDNLLAVGDTDRVLAYCQKVGYEPNYIDLFRKLLHANQIDSAVNFAIKLNEKDDSALDANMVVDAFVQMNMIKQATEFLLEILKNDKASEGPLQTRLLEINLLYSPVQVADSILDQKMFNHFDKQKIAAMCEKVGLHQRALENYVDINDRKRVIVHTQYMNAEWLVNFFADLTMEESITLLKQLMSSNQRTNLNIVIQIATKYSELLEPANLIAIFEEHRSYEGLFYYLGSIVDYTQDPEVVFKYIQSGVKTGQLGEVERVTRESSIYPPEKTKEFLKESKLQDQMPLINVCDQFGFIHEMVDYLYKSQQLRFIDIFIKTRNPLKTPEVVGALLDVDASEDYIRNLVQSVGAMCPVEPLVDEVEKRNRLKLIQPWLEARRNESSQEPALHNALAKIYIDTGNNAEDFLRNNDFYDSRVVGKYCEKRDPHMSFIAYERGQCDLELVEVTNKNGMFRQQARYLVQRQDMELWKHVLAQTNNYRRNLIDQVVQTALPESTNSEEVSTTVKAFMHSDLPQELIELLEKIVIHGSNKEFRKNRHLQNLLILTAIKADQTRVMDYINRLDNYDGKDIAGMAVTKGLFEEAFSIYQKFKLNADAIRVLVDNIESISRASEFAEAVQEPEVYSFLGRAQLAASLVNEAVNSFLKAEDPSNYQEVITAAQQTEQYSQLIKFLRMARGKTHDPTIDTELVYSFAKLAQQKNSADALADLEDFISGPNTAQIPIVGERCYEEGLYEAARILFSSISNYQRLASALVKLGRNREAVNAATKANSVKTWKEVMSACVDAGEFRYAQSCGLNIIIHVDELEDLIFYYESRGYFEELIELLEKGLGLERAHTGIFTELGVLYAKYKPDRLMEHITRYYRRSNIPKLLNACEMGHLWAEMRFLYCHHDEYDNAIKLMIEHSPEAWDHSIFIDTITKDSLINNELYYRSIQFYLDEQPKHVIDLLSHLTKKLDHERVAKEVKNKDASNLPLIKKYLQNVQENDLTQVNQVLNQLFIDEEDYEALRSSIDQYVHFDQAALAKQLENHELLEFRRIAAYLYKLNKQWETSIELSKKDALYQDAMTTAAQSKKQSVAEDLLQFFVEGDLKDCFAACLYNCYNLIRPDVAMELSWRHKIQDMSMPYLIQVVREYTSKVDALHKAHTDAQEQARADEEAKKKALEGVDNYGMNDANMYSYMPSYVPTQTIVAPMGGQGGAYMPYGSTIPQMPNMGYHQEQGGGAFF
ncbi:clathrin heavy chain [Acrasis kona]|uniref:Clathrin heavy chain n=1 Tax=Acrasis kona TaxID=1008807 RepID=A0AAW2YXE6_9EUKA